MMISVRTLQDLLQFSDTAEVVCLYQGEVVRRLSKTTAGEVEIDTITGPAITLPADTGVTFEPWVFDRGSMLIPVPESLGVGPLAKLCGQWDKLVLPDGRSFTINPAEVL